MACRALVLELVDGPTLADRIARGPLAPDDAPPIAKQITEALEAAHEQGIIHRDLKLADIKLRADRSVKVLDFGLAKAFEPVGASGIAVTTSPTITSPAMTQIGVILGKLRHHAGWETIPRRRRDGTGGATTNPQIEVVLTWQDQS